MFFAQIYHSFQKAFFGSQSHQARPKFGEHGVIETCVGQFKTEAIFPIQSTAYSISRLTIRQILYELKDGNQRQPPRSIGWLSAIWIEIEPPAHPGRSYLTCRGGEYTGCP